ncbi:MAG: hypothetical protein BRD51_01745 [Bacteroidetes bacterium SW_11_64_17]|nr:MAG: hypothetical protein BRD51_01745 [Bacteroidetes bacterium SW_11_64_17]
MKRTLLAGTFFLLAGAAALLLAASILYSCRSGGDPHNERSSESHDASTEEMHSDRTPHGETDGRRLTLAHVRAPCPSSAPTSTT